MNPRQLAEQVIKSLNREEALAECACCQRAFRIDRAKLFFINDPTPEARKRIASWNGEITSNQRDLRQRRAQMSQTSQTGAESVNLGFLFEALAPVLPSFPLDPRDCRGLGDPIDLIAFDGLAKYGRAERIVFGDIKTGGSRLSNRQKSIKEAIEKKRLEWSTYED